MDVHDTLGCAQSLAQVTGDVHGWERILVNPLAANARDAALRRTRLASRRRAACWQLASTVVPVSVVEARAQLCCGLAVGDNKLDAILNFAWTAFAP